MNIVLVGMGSQDAAAMAMLVGKTLNGWHCEHVAALDEVQAALSDLCVVDLPSLGMTRFSDSSASALLQAIAGVPTILLTAANNETWTGLYAIKASSQWLEFLSKPYKASDMRLVLERCAPKGRALQAPPKPAVPEPELAPEPEVSTPMPVAQQAPVFIAPPAAALVNSEVSTLAQETGDSFQEEISAEEFLLRVQQLDKDAPTAFLRKFADCLETGETIEMRFTVQHSILVCPAEQWIATNTPMVVIQRLARSDALASVVQTRRIDSEAALQLADRLQMSLQPLDSFLWELLQGRVPPAPATNTTH